MYLLVDLQLHLLDLVQSIWDSLWVLNSYVPDVEIESYLTSYKLLHRTCLVSGTGMSRNQGLTSLICSKS